MLKPFNLFIIMVFGALSAAAPAFAQDLTPPSVSILNPADSSYVNSLPSITGTAADDVAVSSVVVSLKNPDTNKYWGGSAWDSDAVTWFSATIFPSSWTYLSPTWVSGSTYTVNAKAMDTSANWSAVYATSTFVYDTSTAAYSFLVTQRSDAEVPAGSLIAPGNLSLTAQFADAFENSVSSQGVPVYIAIGEVYGSTGVIQYQSGGGWYDIGTSTVMYTDSQGRVGVSTPIAYKVSSLSGDWARVWIGTAPINPATYATYAAARQNVSGRLTTIGGTPSKLVFVSSQAEAQVGIQEVVGSGAAFTVGRRDDFDNATKQGETGVYLFLPSAQVTVHTGLGRTLGTVGNAGDYGFRDTSHTEFVSAVIIPPDQTQASFRYHDRTTSYSGASPALNTYEDGRPGYWQLEARSGAMQPAFHQLRVNPAEVVQVAFGNAPLSMIAGKQKDRYGDVQVFKAELRDMFDNPSVATAAVQVVLSTFTRQASLINDSFSFSVSSTVSGAFPPVFASTISYLNIPLDAYTATFYYLDTTASSVYSSSMTPIRPILKLSVPERAGWAASTQSVTILPDLTYRMNVRGNAGQTLIAGATSQAFDLSIEDRYGNPTPVASGQEDSGGAGVAFSLTSDSGGSVQFSAPGPAGFAAQPGTARMALDQASTSFYLIDTLVSAPTHQLTINTVLSKGWLPAVSSYTVTQSGPDHLEFLTPPRRLIAGTTLQYADYSLGITTPAMVTVALKDAYGNIAAATSAVTVRFSAANNTTYGGIDPSVPVLSSNPSWRLLKTNPVDIQISVGQSYANIYVWDTIAGTAPVTAEAYIVGFSSASQEQYITPSTAAFFTLSHNYTLGSPLRVRAPGYLTLRARDQYGNIAAGDGINSNYYTGKIKMATNSNGIAELWSYPPPYTTDYTFVPDDRGEHTLLLQDTMVETLKVSVTDYNRPSVFGYTADSGRGLPVGSSDDVILSGLVITPRDFSPEDPLPVSKTSIGLTKTALRQGDGSTAGVPAPVPMLRLTMQAVPAGAPPAYINSVQVRSSGTLAYTDIAWIGMYADNTAAGQVGVFDGETVLGGSPVDILMSSGTYDPGMGTWLFEDLPSKVSTAAIVSNTSRNFFFAVRLSTTAATPRSFGLVMDNPDFVVISSTLVGVAGNNFPVITATSPVRGQPATVRISGSDIGAWWIPAASAAGKYSYVEQGTERAGFLAIQAWTDNFTGTIQTFRIIKTGTGAGSDLKSVRLFLDDGDGFFGQAIDKEVTDPANPPAFDPADPGTFVLPLYNPGLDGLISVSTRTYFVVYEFTPDAVPSPLPLDPNTMVTHGARLENSAVSLLDGVVGVFAPIVSSTVPLYATADMVYLQDVNKAAPNDFSKPSFVTQNDINKAVARLTLEIRDSAGSAVWRGLKLDRWVTGAENGNTPAWNKVTDVKKISVWQDSTGNGLLETTTTVKDTEVLLPSVSTRTFPYDTLRLPLASTDTVIRVNNIQLFFPADSPFPMAPGRLIMNDGQSDPALKEVVYYSTVNALDNAFGGLTRGAEATTPAVWSSGTVISGQAILPLSGAGGSLEGQGIYVTPKDYFVTYDINTLANVSSLSNLGLAIRSTDYFYIDSPKLMSASNIGVTAPGKTLSLIGRVAEYADAVTVDAADTVSIQPLPAMGVNQPLLDFTLRTDVADAMWRWMLVYATGTVVQDGTAVEDVAAVKVWHDLDNNGLLDGSDVMIGSGTFANTILGPLVAKVAFAAEQRVITSGAAQAAALSRRYLLTYDIKDSALPVDGIGNPRYLGAYIKAESFPQNSPSAEDPVKNAFSLPNYYATDSPLPFVSSLRAIATSTTLPTVGIAEPVNNSLVNSLPQLSGTAADDVAVSSVAVSILRLTDNYYWDSASWAAGQAWLNAGVTGSSWTYAGVPSWVSNSSYTVMAKAADSSGNWSAAYSTSVFSYDGTAPASGVTVPETGSVSSFTYLSGTAADAGGIAQVRVSVKRWSDANYWAGAGWVSTETWNLASGTTAWLYTAISSAALTDGATYLAMSKSYDLAGNISNPFNNSSTFTYAVPHTGELSSAAFSGIGISSLTVNWGATFNYSTFYYVRLSTMAGATPYVFTATTTGSSYGFTGLNANTGYYGFVSTMPAGGYLLTDDGVTLAEAPSSAVFAAVVYSSAALSWSGGANPSWTAYQYEVSPSSSFGVIASSASGSVQSGWLTGLAQGTTYYGRVRAYNSEGLPTGYAHTASWTKTLVLFPAGLAAGISGAAPGTNSITWTWDSGTLTSADNFALYSGSGGVIAVIPFALSASYDQLGLSTNSAYMISVAGRNGNGDGPLAASATVYTLAAAPAGLAASQVAVSSAALSWALNGNSAGTTAQLFRSADNISFSNAFEGAALSFNDTSLQECSAYYYKARNRNGGGLYSDFGSAISFTTQASTPTAPSGLYAEALNGARIALFWDYSPWPGVTQYKLYSDNASGTIDYAAPFAVYSSTVSSWTTPALTAGSSYKFNLRATNSCGIEEKNITVFASAQAVGSLTGVRAGIKSPQTGKRIQGNRVTVMAEIILGTVSQIKQVRFQYRLLGGGAWADIAAANPRHTNPDQASPYFVHWNADAMAPGTYELRALATDIYNADDSAPPTITVVTDPLDYDIKEMVVAGELQKDQKINNSVTNTVHSTDDSTALVAKVVIPSGALNISTVTVTVVNNPASKPPAPLGVQDLDMSFKINLSNSQSLLSGGNTATLTFTYKDDDGNGIVDGTTASVDRLKMYSASGIGDAWTLLVSSVDKDKKTISGVTPHFSFFSVFSPSATGLETIKAYPNPWQPGSGGIFDSAPGITFANLPAAATIKIFTLVGELVRVLEVAAADGGIKVWDGRNMEGHKAASGIYLALVKAGSSQKTLKVAVER
ncbi:MAG: Ig-like domain-containing protein [Elusimicrobiota bacterium]|nr:Ig-like domain-containing protein [Elusimicrobiota bacterium]